MTTFIKWITFSKEDLLEYIGPNYDTDNWTREELEDFAEQLYGYGNRGTDIIIKAEEDSIKSMKLLTIMMNTVRFMNYKTLNALCSSRTDFVGLCRTNYMWLSIIKERLGNRLGGLFKHEDRSTLKQVVVALESKYSKYDSLRSVVGKELSSEVYFDLEVKCKTDDELFTKFREISNYGGILTYNYLTTRDTPLSDELYYEYLIQSMIHNPDVFIKLLNLGKDRYQKVSDMSIEQMIINNLDMEEFIYRANIRSLINMLELGIITSIQENIFYDRSDFFEFGELQEYYVTHFDIDEDVFIREIDNIDFLRMVRDRLPVIFQEMIDLFNEDVGFLSRIPKETPQEVFEYLTENGLQVTNEKVNDLMNLKDNISYNLITLSDLNVEDFRNTFNKILNEYNIHYARKAYTFLKMQLPTLFMNNTERIIIMLRKYMKGINSTRFSGKMRIIKPSKLVKKYKKTFNTILDDADITIYDNLILALVLDAQPGTFPGILREMLIERGADEEQATVTQANLLSE